MIFGPDHYVPVLKLKQGEKGALRAVDNRLRPRITPLLEIVERPQNKTLDKHLDTAFKDLRDALVGYGRFFLEAREIGPDSAGALAAFDRAAKAGMIFTPVTGISRTSDVDAALRHRENGVAIRLTREEFEHRDLQRALPRFMTERSLSLSEVDLIVDLGPLDDLVQFGVANLAKAFLDDVPDKSQWRTLTLSGSAFPKSMGCVERNSFAVWDRSEWKTWQDDLYAVRGQLERLPSFSDCAIQHPSGVEGFNFLTMQVSAAIRYALSDEWLLLKGQSTRATPPSEQFPALATRLVYGHLRDRYQGEAHCAGCASIKRAADGSGGLGSAAVWRRLGTVHHITTVANALGALSWP